MSTPGSVILKPLPQLARKNDLSYLAIWRAASAGQIACVQVGRKYLAVPADVERWAAERKGTGPDPQL